MSFGFSVGDFIAVIQLASKVRKAFVGAPDQFKEISDEVRSLSIILQDIDTFLDGTGIPDHKERDLGEITRSCRRVLEDTEKTLGKYRELGPGDKSIGRTAKRAWKRLNFEPDNIGGLRSQITSNITLLGSFLHGFTRDSIAEIVKRQDQDEHQRILSWLAATDYSTQQSDFIRRRQAGTGRWLLESPKYQEWVAMKGQVLFCPGIPGAGKTIVASIVVDNLCDRFRTDSSVGICYIYCSYRRNAEQRLGDLLASLVKQLAWDQSPFPESVTDLYNRHGGKTRPTVDEVGKTLHSVAARYSRVFVVIDALDECQTSDDCQFRFITELLKLQAELGANILVTSRFIPEVQDRFDDCISIEIRATDDDINDYLGGNLSSLPRFVSRDPDLQNEIKQRIMRCVDGMFLLAQLHLTSLEGKRSKKTLRVALGDLANGTGAYDVAYKSAMDQIQGQSSDQKELALQTLTWISCAKRPLTTVELRHALAVELYEPALDEDNVPDIEDLVSSCCGLVTVDAESDVIRLVHYTTQEYFQQTQKDWFPDADSDITNTCITYLSFQAFESGMCETSLEFEERYSSYPLHSYASIFWGDHAQSASDYEHISKFLQTEPKVDASVQQYLVRKGMVAYLPFHLHHDMRLTGVDLAAFHGLREVLMILVDEHNLDKPTPGGKTPLTIAAYRGHTATVQMLLEKGADPNLKDELGEWPLWHAAKDGHVAVVQLLLENGADVNSKDNRGETPLCRAVEAGHKAVVQLLLEKGANVNSNTHLWSAPENEHEAVVRLPLDEEADGDLEGQSTRTPLFYATHAGNEAMVQLLLERHAKAWIGDNFKRFPLLYAIKELRSAIFDLLLPHHRLLINITDYYGSTALSVAARFGRIEMVQALLAIPGVDIGSVDNFGRTPLWWARKQGHGYIAERLLERADCLGIDLSEVEMSLAPASFGDTKGQCCDGCWASIKVPYYCCKPCSIYTLYICLECQERGAHCLDKTHKLSYCK